MGWAPMLKQPELEAMSDAQWRRLLHQKEKHLLVVLWNRQTKDRQWLYLSINYGVPALPLPFYGSGISIGNIPDALVTESILTAMMDATIEWFQPESAEIGRGYHVGPTIDPSSMTEGERHKAISDAQTRRSMERLKDLCGGL